MGDGPKRPVVEMMVLMLTGTVCAVLILIGVGIAVIEVVNPEADTSGGVVALGSVTSTLLGALLGLLAGRNIGRPSSRADE